MIYTPLYSAACPLGLPQRCAQKTNEVDQLLYCSAACSILGSVWFLVVYRMPEHITFCSIIQLVSTQTALFDAMKVNVGKTLLQKAHTTLFTIDLLFYLSGKTAVIVSVRLYHLIRNFSCWACWLNGLFFPRPKEMNAFYIKYLTTVYVVWKLNGAHSHFDTWKPHGSRSSWNKTMF